MKKLTLIFSVSTLLLSLFIPTIATATTVPNFEPVTQNISSQLPKGMSMRLPKSIKITGSEGLIGIYTTMTTPRINQIRVDLTSQPNCKAKFCQIGYIGTAIKGYEYPMLRPLSSTRKAGEANITLAEGVVGKYYSLHPQGASSGPYAIVKWEQDGQTYLVSLPLFAKENRQQILDIATSMANGDSITTIR